MHAIHVCLCSSADENHDLKNALAELTRRYHELELENRRLENERQELAAAYKEAEAVSTPGHRDTL